MPGWNRSAATTSIWSPLLIFSPKAALNPSIFQGMPQGRYPRRSLPWRAKTYTLGWYMAGNNDCGQAIKSMAVDWNGTTVQGSPFMFNTAGHTLQWMDGCQSK